MPPETLMGKAVDAAPSIDVWAIGIMFYSLLYGTLPFYSKQNEDTTIKLIKTATVKFPKDIIVTPQTREIITKMLEKDPEKRIELMDVMDTEYYRMDDEAFKAMVSTYYEQNKPKEEEKEPELSLEELKIINNAGKKSPRGRSPSPKSKAKKAKRDEEEKYAWVD